VPFEAPAGRVFTHLSSHYGVEADVQLDLAADAAVTA